MPRATSGARGVPVVGNVPGVGAGAAVGIGGDRMSKTSLTSAVGGTPGVSPGGDTSRVGSVMGGPDVVAASVVVVGAAVVVVAASVVVVAAAVLVLVDSGGQVVVVVLTGGGWW
jgi:hypothetical protein